MESYIQISKINDFLYSPQSLYLHSVYESFSQKVYHEAPQIIGNCNHERIDSGKYSTSTRYLQGFSVYSEKFNLGGKIDIYDKQLKILVERKTRIKQIHDGHKFQLYAQMFALEEMGYLVDKLCIHSLDDNKRYVIPLPDIEEMDRFNDTLNKMRAYQPNKPEDSKYRCDLSIYRHLSY